MRLTRFAIVGLALLQSLWTLLLGYSGADAAIALAIQISSAIAGIAAATGTHLASMLATAASGAALLIPIWLMTGSLANGDWEEFDWTIRNMRIGFGAALCLFLLCLYWMIVSGSKRLVRPELHT